MATPEGPPKEDFEDNVSDADVQQEPSEVPSLCEDPPRLHEWEERQRKGSGLSAASSPDKRRGSALSGHSAETVDGVLTQPLGERLKAMKKHASSHFAKNAGVMDGEKQVVAEHHKRGYLGDLEGDAKVSGAAYYCAEDIERYSRTAYTGLAYQVSSLSNINSVSESFRIVLDLNMMYKIDREDKVKYEEYKAKGTIEFQDIVDDRSVKVGPPVFEIRNAIETPEMYHGRVVGIQRCFDHRIQEWGWYVTMYLQVRCECYEEFEMKRFPFARNALQVQMQCCRAMSDVMLVPMNSRSALPHHFYDEKAKLVKEVFPRGNSLKVGLNSGNWSVEQHHAFFVPHEMLPPMPSGNKFSTCLLTVQCKQKANFYIWNTALVIFFLPLLSMLCVVEDVSEVALRMSIVLTLLLTMSTYKIVIADWIPQKDYLTFMDWYIIGGFALILVIAFWCAASAFMVEWFDDEAFSNSLEQFESWLMAALAVIWVVPHCWVLSTWNSWYLNWTELLKDENARLQEIASEVSNEREDMSKVQLLCCDEPELPPDDE